MNLEKILSVSGKPGLFKVVKQSKKGLVLQRIGVGSHLSVRSSYPLSTLDGIMLYTYEGEVPLLEVFGKMNEKYKGEQALGHKESRAKLRAEFSEILPNFDAERVCDSHIKKVFQWYNILQTAGLLAEEESPAKSS